LFYIAAFGAGLVFLGIGCQVVQLVLSFLQRKENQDKTGDPWKGRTLEWSTSSPPPVYNFASLPLVDKKDPLEEGKKEVPVYEDIHIPKDTPIGFFIGVASFFVGFGLIWHMFWLAIFSLACILICYLVRWSDLEPEERLPAAALEEKEKKHASRV
jgi:cytochrome o ubiquinol oxidase subunit 1